LADGRVVLLAPPRQLPAVGEGEGVEAVPPSSPGGVVTPVTEVQTQQRGATGGVVADLGGNPVALAPRVRHQFQKTGRQGNGKEIFPTFSRQGHLFADHPPEWAGQLLVSLELVTPSPRQASLDLSPRLLRIPGARDQEPSHCET